MRVRGSWFDEASAILRQAPAGVRVLHDVPLSGRTHLRIGGPARLLIVAHEPESLATLIGRFHAAGVPFDYLGAGSNLLVADRGPSFVVIASEGFSNAPRISGANVRVGSGFPLPRLIITLRESGLSGLEFAEGIPGSVGGAVRMNAGWHQSEFGSAVISLTTIERRGILQEASVEDGTFAYRSSPGLRDRFVVEASLQLVPDDPARIAERMRFHRDRRAKTQPTGARTAGCIFRNPAGDHAGRLIDACGLKGLAVGDACISEVHANFIINRGGATFEDVSRLIDAARDTVHKKTGVILEPEVIRWT